MLSIPFNNTFFPCYTLAFTTLPGGQMENFESELAKASAPDVKELLRVVVSVLHRDGMSSARISILLESLTS
jgi:hypothetical protein